jgi:hypothetical protein
MWELLSGPDLGAGFLFQLTVERGDPNSLFCYHAQPGGQDAGGPPLGSPEPLGFDPVVDHCPLGGRLCWHREFRLSAERTLTMRTAYNRTRLMMGARLRQATTPDVAAAEEGLERLVEVLAVQNAPPLRWAVPPTVRAWLEAEEDSPPRIGFQVAPEDVARVEESLSAYLVEPGAQTTWPPQQSVLAGRAFLGNIDRGVDVEWRAWEGGAPQTRPITWHGRSILAIV